MNCFNCKNCTRKSYHKLRDDIFLFYCEAEGVGAQASTAYVTTWPHALILKRWVRCFGGDVCLVDFCRFLWRFSHILTHGWPLCVVSVDCFAMKCRSCYVLAALTAQTLAYALINEDSGKGRLSPAVGKTRMCHPWMCYGRSKCSAVALLSRFHPV